MVKRSQREMGWRGRRKMYNGIRSGETLFTNSHKGPIVTEGGGRDDEGQDR